MNKPETQGDAQREAIKERLRNHGIIPTHQRIEIASLLFERPQHLSADQVLARVNKRHALVSKATVYNTLGLFARLGLVREVVVDPSRLFYDSNLSHHHHMLNVETGELIDIEALDVPLPSLPELPEGTRLEGVDVVIRVRGQS